MMFKQTFSHFSHFIYFDSFDHYAACWVTLIYMHIFHFSKGQENFNVMSKMAHLSLRADPLALNKTEQPLQSKSSKTSSYLRKETGCMHVPSLFIQQPPNPEHPTSTAPTSLSTVTPLIQEGCDSSRVGLVTYWRRRRPA